MALNTNAQLTGILHDLSAREAIEHELRKSEERLRSIVESAVDGIIVIDESGRIQSFNPAAVRLFGYTPEEVAGQNIKMLMPSPDHEQHDGYIRNYLDTGKARIIGIGREVRGQRKDGSVFPLHLSVGEMRLEGRKYFTGILQDLSYRVALEK